MVESVLNLLVSDDFLMSLGVISSASGLRRAVGKSTVVAKVRRALQSREITEASLDRFVNNLMQDFNRGVQFPHEPALAAISLVLEDRKTDFADEFLLDLARLNIVEMMFAPAVARESRRRWATLPSSKRERPRDYGLEIERFVVVSCLS